MVNAYTGKDGYLVLLILRIKGGIGMNEQAIRNVLAKIESCMMMTCEGCAMPKIIKPLIDEIKKQLDSKTNS